MRIPTDSFFTLHLTVKSVRRSERFRLTIAKKINHMIYPTPKSIKHWTQTRDHSRDIWLTFECSFFIFTGSGGVVLYTLFLYLNWKQNKLLNSTFYRR